jgi:hypothetical protein
MNPRGLSKRGSKRGLFGPIEARRAHSFRKNMGRRFRRSDIPGSPPQEGQSVSTPCHATSRFGGTFASHDLPPTRSNSPSKLQFPRCRAVDRARSRSNHTATHKLCRQTASNPVPVPVTAALGCHSPSARRGARNLSRLGPLATLPLVRRQPNTRADHSATAATGTLQAMGDGDRRNAWNWRSRCANRSDPRK